MGNVSNLGSMALSQSSTPRLPLRPISAALGTATQRRRSMWPDVDKSMLVAQKSSATGTNGRQSRPISAPPLRRVGAVPTVQTRVSRPASGAGAMVEASKQSEQVRPENNFGAEQSSLEGASSNVAHRRPPSSMRSRSLDHTQQAERSEALKPCSSPEESTALSCHSSACSEPCGGGFAIKRSTSTRVCPRPASALNLHRPRLPTSRSIATSTSSNQNKSSSRQNSEAVLNSGHDDKGSSQPSLPVASADVEARATDSVVVTKPKTNVVRVGCLAYIV